ncbi:uncharacterized protein [Medicago truncatula]|nr:uncharacterized protein LOC11439122 [Medicago truncatula]
MVKRKSCFYYLPDSLPIRYVFPKMRETWFLHVEVGHLKLRLHSLPCDAAILSNHQDLMTYDCENKTRCNSEEKRQEGLHPCAYLSEENEAINQVLKEKGNSHENYKQHTASGMPERHSCGFGDKPTSTVSKSQCPIPENKDENLVELRANSRQESPSKMSTQVISVSGIINKYFLGFNGIDNDNFSCSSNSEVTSRAVRSEIEVQSSTSAQSCYKRQIDPLPQFSPKTPPHVPLHVDFVSKSSGSKTRRSKVKKCSKPRKPKAGKCSENRPSKLGKLFLSASKSLGVYNTKNSPALSLCKFKNKNLLEQKSHPNGSIFSISDSDD